MGMMGKRLWEGRMMETVVVGEESEEDAGENEDEDEQIETQVVSDIDNDDEEL